MAAVLLYNRFFYRRNSSHLLAMFRLLLLQKGFLIGSVLPRVWVCPLLKCRGACRCPGMLRAAGFFCVSPGVHRAAVLPLSGIEKPGSGCPADFTSDGQEPLNREHITCSW